MSYSEVFQSGVNAAMAEVCAAKRECDGSADDMYLRASERVQRLEGDRRRADVIAAAGVQ